MEHQNRKVFPSRLEEQHPVGVMDVEPHLKGEEPVYTGLHWSARVPRYIHIQREGVVMQNTQWTSLGARPSHEGERVWQSVWHQDYITVD